MITIINSNYKAKITKLKWLSNEIFSKMKLFHFSTIFDFINKSLILYSLKWNIINFG
jgi:hypothetical protein